MELQKKSYHANHPSIKVKRLPQTYNFYINFYNYIPFPNYRCIYF